MSARVNPPYRGARGPCYQCPDRNAECHCSCEKYKAFVEVRKKQHDTVYSDKEVNNAIFDARTYGMRRTGCLRKMRRNPLKKKR